MFSHSTPPSCPASAASRRRLSHSVLSRFVLALLLASAAGGCTSLRQWWRQGMRVGPDYCPPDAPVAGQWIDAKDPHLSSVVREHADWWRVFNDPTLETLVLTAYEQNPSLQAAGWRVIEERAQRRITAGGFFPQTQNAFGSYTRQQISKNAIFPSPLLPRAFDNWTTGFDLSWELDVWGRIRRSIEATDAELTASVEDYDDVLVTLIGDVAASYIELRSYDERIRLAEENIGIQQQSFDVAKARLAAGRATQLDVDQAQSNLADTHSLVPLLQQGRRQSQNRLAILLGMPPAAIAAQLSQPGPIPASPEQAVVGIPAELLRRRPDIRRAERQMAAQCARIGVAEADLYPQLSLNGELKLQSEDFSDLFSSTSSAGFIAPQFRWKILNYGRIMNNVRVQEARFQQEAARYEKTVLDAQREVEDALVQFLRSRERAAWLHRSVEAAQRTVDIASIQYGRGKIDYDRVFILEATLVRLQDRLVSAQADVAIGLVRVYKALGGGWQLRLGEIGQESLPAAATAQENR